MKVDRPIAEVFHAASEQIADWSITVSENEILDRTPDGIGTTFRVVTEDRGKRLVFDGTVTHHDPPNFHAVRMTNPMFDIETELTFEELDGHTRVTQVAIVTGKGAISC